MPKTEANKMPKTEGKKFWLVAQNIIKQLDEIIEKANANANATNDGGDDKSN